MLAPSFLSLEISRLRRCNGSEQGAIRLDVYKRGAG